MNRTRFIIVLTMLAIYLLPLSTNAHEDVFVYQRETVCLKEFPVQPALFKDYVTPYVTQIIEKHGLEEWKAVLITNEFHRHLGIWSIVGAKMGIRAREVMEMPFDEIAVVSYAGNKPPYSCLTDGLQVSTGASLGRGTITVLSHPNEPSADFMFKGRKITLKAKPQVVKTIGEIIRDYSGKYGFQSPRYFQELDKISVEYWLKLDRKEIFEEIR